METAFSSPAVEKPKRLTRNTSHRILGGVAAGLASYFNLDRILVRILFLISGIAGFGIIAYLLLWIFIPQDHSVTAETSRPELSQGTTRKAHLLIGSALILLGVFWLFDNLDFYWMDSIGRFFDDFSIPVLLMACGIAVIYFSKTTETDEKETEMDQPQEPKRLYRVMRERMIAGVCSGLGYYFKVDPVLVRILFLISVFISFGATLLVYLVLALVTPKEDGFQS